MKQNDNNERISDWMSLLEDDSVPMDGQAERTDALRTRVRLGMTGSERRRISVKWLPLAAAVLALTVTTAFAADCVISQRMPFIFHSVETLQKEQYQNEMANVGDADEYTAFGYNTISDDPADPEALAALGQEEIPLRFEVSSGDGETLISDEEGTDSDPYTRKQVVKVVNGGQVDETIKLYQETRCTGTGLAQIIVQEPLLKKWDLSGLEENYPMVEGCNFLLVRNDWNGGFLYSRLWGMYRTENGGTFAVEAMSDTNTNYDDDYTSVGADGFSETYTTEDGTRVSIYGNGTWTYADLVLTTEDYYEDFSVSGQGITQEEMERIVDSLNLATFVSSFTAAAGGE